MAQKGNGRRNPHHGLADKGEDSKQSNGLGAKMHHVDLVMGKHRIEEGVKWGNQACLQGVGEELVLRDDPVEGGVRRGPDRRLPALIEVGGKRGADLLQGLQVEYERFVDGGSSRRGRAGRRRRFLPLILFRRRHGNGTGEELEMDWRRKQRLEEERGTRSAQVAKGG